MAKQMAKLTVTEFFAGLRKPVIVTMCGSQRDGSFNQMLHDHAVRTLEDKGRAVVRPIDLAALQLPLYNPNEDKPKQHDDDSPAASFPAAAKQLKADLAACDGMLITSPEYNGFVSPLLLNSITWATRGDGGMYDAFKGKVVSVLATSPGPMGGLRMIRSLSTFMGDMGSVVLPGNSAIGNATTVFDQETGRLTDERAVLKVEAACEQLVHFTRYEANRERDCAIAHEVMKLKTLGEYGEVELPQQ